MMWCVVIRVGVISSACFKVTSNKKKCAVLFKWGWLPDKMFDKEQLRRGVIVESEHTSSRCLAKQISKAHLREDPKYYNKAMFKADLKRYKR